MGVQVSVVLTRVQGSVFLWYKEEGRSLRGFQGDYSPSFQMFFDERFAHLHLCRVEQIDLGDFGSEVGAEFNGVVIGMVGRELVMSFL